jgi:hypothetical protein
LTDVSKRTVASYRIAGLKAWETRCERNERVLVNIPADHAALWDTMKDSFHGADSAHARFESFTKYAEEHPDEVVAAIQASADAKLDEMLASRDAVRFDDGP